MVKSIVFVLLSTSLTSKFLYASEKPTAFEKLMQGPHLTPQQFSRIMAQQMEREHKRLSSSPTILEHQPKKQYIHDILLDGLTIAEHQLHKKCTAIIENQNPDIKPMARLAGQIIVDIPAMVYFSEVKNRYPLFNRHDIYFDHQFASIQEHADYNPNFGNVKLALSRGDSLFGRLFFKPFNVIGTYSNQHQREILMDEITENGGLWCPEQNTIIGGTRDKNMCTAFAKFEKKYANKSTE